MWNRKERDVKGDSRVLSLDTGRMKLVVAEMGKPTGRTVGGGGGGERWGTMSSCLAKLTTGT